MFLNLHHIHHSVQDRLLERLLTFYQLFVCVILCSPLVFWEPTKNQTHCEYCFSLQQIMCRGLGVLFGIALSHCFVSGKRITLLHSACVRVNCNEPLLTCMASFHIARLACFEWKSTAFHKFFFVFFLTFHNSLVWFNRSSGSTSLTLPTHIINLIVWITSFNCWSMCYFLPVQLIVLYFGIQK